MNLDEFSNLGNVYQLKINKEKSKIDGGSTSDNTANCPSKNELYDCICICKSKKNCVYMCIYMYIYMYTHSINVLIIKNDWQLVEESLNISKLRRRTANHSQKIPNRQVSSSRYINSYTVVQIRFVFFSNAYSIFKTRPELQHSN